MSDDLQAVRDFLSSGEWGEPESADHNAAFILLASAILGPCVKRIAKATGIPLDIVQTIGAQARRHKIWRGAKVHAEWADEDCGGVALACDVACVLGLLQRV